MMITNEVEARAWLRAWGNRPRLGVLNATNVVPNGCTLGPAEPCPHCCPLGSGQDEHKVCDSCWGTAWIRPIIDTEDGSIDGLVSAPAPSPANKD